MKSFLTCATSALLVGQALAHPLVPSKREEANQKEDVDTTVLQLALSVCVFISLLVILPLGPVLTFPNNTAGTPGERLLPESARSVVAAAVRRCRL